MHTRPTRVILTLQQRNSAFRSDTLEAVCAAPFGTPLLKPVRVDAGVLAADCARHTVGVFAGGARQTI